MPPERPDQQDWIVIQIVEVERREGEMREREK
jgi:hypothetical protein